MTDHHNAITVVLDHDIRSDDVEAVIAAIRLIRGVIDVRYNVPEIGELEPSDFIGTEKLIDTLCLYRAFDHVGEDPPSLMHPLSRWVNPASGVVMRRNATNTAWEREARLVRHGALVHRQ